MCSKAKFLYNYVFRLHHKFCPYFLLLLCSRSTSLFFFHFSNQQIETKKFLIMYLPNETLTNECLTNECLINAFIISAFQLWAIFPLRSCSQCTKCSNSCSDIFFFNLIIDAHFVCKCAQFYEIIKHNLNGIQNGETNSFSYHIFLHRYYQKFFLCALSLCCAA